MGCPTNYPYKPGLFPITIPFKEYRLKRVPIDKQKETNRAERRIKRKAIKNKRDELNSQKIARKKHISQQTPKVQERMKKSFIESEKTRKRKTLWERILLWKKKKNIERKR